ncbi:MAG TPA: hypothetical protein VHS09_12785, partial [Polyangiaceae bacterium]|nr:hypothetical protein [Polyangiaceae bacterium]
LAQNVNQENLQSQTQALGYGTQLQSQNDQAGGNLLTGALGAVSGAAKFVGGLFSSDERVKQELSPRAAYSDMRMGGAPFTLTPVDRDPFTLPSAYGQADVNNLTLAQANMNGLTGNPMAPVGGGGWAEGGGAGVGPSGAMGGTYGDMRIGESRLKEPGGPAEWVFREEPNYILAYNARTGDMRKVVTAALTPEERRQAMAPHGAGPLPRRTHADMALGGASPMGDPSTLAPPQGAQPMIGATGMPMAYPPQSPGNSVQQMQMGNTGLGGFGGQAINMGGADVSPGGGGPGAPSKRGLSKAEAMDLLGTSAGSFAAGATAQGTRGMGMPGQVQIRGSNPTGAQAGNMVSDKRAKEEAHQAGYDAAVRDVTGNTELLRKIAGSAPPRNVPMPEGGYYVRDGRGAYQAQPYSPPPPALPAPPSPSEMSAMGYTVPGVERPAPAPARIPWSPPPPAPADPRLAQNGALVSDERMKQMEGSHSGVAAADAFLRSLEPHAFTWRDPSLAPNPEAASRPNLGIYAQQVEQTPWGRAIVQNDPQTGLKTIDPKAMTGALAAGTGALRAQVDEQAERLALLERALGRSPQRSRSAEAR